MISLPKNAICNKYRNTHRHVPMLDATLERSWEENHKRFYLLKTSDWLPDLKQRGGQPAALWSCDIHVKVYRAEFQVIFHRTREQEATTSYMLALKLDICCFQFPLFLSVLSSWSCCVPIEAQKRFLPSTCFLISPSDMRQMLYLNLIPCLYIGVLFWLDQPWRRDLISRDFPENQRITMATFWFCFTLNTWFNLLLDVPYLASRCFHLCYSLISAAVPALQVI